jgi:hypothetical protein
MSSPFFDRAGLLELLTALAERLQARAVRAKIYVVGGAAISLLGVLGITQVEGALQVHETVFPGVVVSDRVQLLLEDILNQ